MVGGVGQRLARSFKIWGSDPSHWLTRGKTQENCGVGCVHSRAQTGWEEGSEESLGHRTGDHLLSWKDLMKSSGCGFPSSLSGDKKKG